MTTAGPVPILQRGMRPYSLAGTEGRGSAPGQIWRRLGLPRGSGGWRQRGLGRPSASTRLQVSGPQSWSAGKKKLAPFTASSQAMPPSF